MKKLIIFFLFLFILFFQINAQSNIEETKKQQWDKLMYHVKNGDTLKVAKVILTEFPIYKDTLYTVSNMLQEALISNQIEMFNFILIHKSFKNVDINLNSKFIFACSISNIKTIQYFLEKGLPFYDNNFPNPIYNIVYYRNFSYLKYFFVKDSVKINQKFGENQQTLLFISIFSKQGNLRKVKFLLKNGADKNIKDSYGKRPYDYIDDYVKLPWKSNKLKKLLK